MRLVGRCAGDDDGDGRPSIIPAPPSAKPSQCCLSCLCDSRLLRAKAKSQHQLLGSLAPPPFPQSLLAHLILIPPHHHASPTRRDLSDLPPEDERVQTLARRWNVAPHVVIQRLRALGVGRTWDDVEEIQKEIRCRELLTRPNVIICFESPLTNSADSTSLSGHQHRRQR